MERNRLSWDRLTFPTRDWVNTRWYDISRGVTTCGEEKAAGNGHQPAWTSVVRNWFTRLHTQPGFLERTVIDIGCGKGKVLLVWGDQLRKHGYTQQTLGIEANRSMADQARVNFHKRKQDTPVFTADACEFPYDSLVHPLLIWLFNPFGENNMWKLSEQLQDTNTLMVYHNPKHAAVFLDAGWQPLSIEAGIHEKNTSMLLTNRWTA